MAQTDLRTPSGNVFTSDNPEFHKGCERLTQTAGKAARREYVARILRGMLKPGQTVFTILRHVSSSGMSRRISLVVPEGDGIRCIDTLAADLLGDRVHDSGGIVVTKCGMDMGFHLVYNLGARLWPDGTPTPHGTRNGQPDTSGGYALKHSWL